jgi:hypothetical protein
MVLTVMEYLLLYFNAKYNVITTKTVAILFGILIFTSIIYYFLVKLTIKGYSIEKLVHKINEIPAYSSKNIVLGFVAISFFHQYYFFVSRFDVDLPYLTLYGGCDQCLFLGILITHFSVFDLAVKGVAIFFGILDVNEWIVILYRR